jgi:hypothetical protein
MINPIEIQTYLKGITYPASKQQLIDKANENGATPEVMAALHALPDIDYQTPTDVQAALSDEEEEIEIDDMAL